MSSSEPTGAGKSNFVDFFRLLRALADESFQSFVNEQGGGDGLLFLGPKKTPKISAHLAFGKNVYEFVLKPTASGTLQLKEEKVKYTGGGGFQYLSAGAMESALQEAKGRHKPLGGERPAFPTTSIRRCQTGRFTIFTTPARCRPCVVINRYETGSDSVTMRPTLRRSWQI